MNFENITLEKGNGIGYVTINRPKKLNALNKATIEELNTAFLALEDDNEVRVKDLVFEPKFTTKSSGMGLGLPIIKNIIEAYHGSISFTSKKDIGTIFTVILPTE